MTTDSIDETIEKIETDIAENEIPLPKAAPTQPYVKSLSLRLSEETDESEASTSVIWARENPDPECRARTFEALCGITQRPSSWTPIHIPPNLSELREQIIRTPLAELHEVLPEGSFFTLRCRECNFRFRSVECPLELAHQHSNWQNHRVACTLHVGEHELQIETFPVEPSWSERHPHIYGLISRFYRSLWCGGTCVFCFLLSTYDFLTASGLGRWWHVLMMVVWSSNTVNWFKNWREHRKEKEE